MNLKPIDNKTLRTIGLVTLAAGALYYPAMKLFNYLRTKQSNGNKLPTSNAKNFAPSYRGKHKPHHRQAHSHNGELA